MIEPLAQDTTAAEQRLQEITGRSIVATPELEARVSQIVSDVRARGDEAVLAYTEEFDGVSLTPDTLRVDPDAIVTAHAKAPRRQYIALLRM